MKRLTLGILGLGLVGLLFAMAPEAPAKEKDPKVIHEKLVKKFETKKGGKLFSNDEYWVDVEEIDDTRWSIEPGKKPKASEAQALVMRASYTPSLGQPPAISITIIRTVHKKGPQPQSISFGNCGESAKGADVKEMTRLTCLNNRKVFTDVKDKLCVEIDKAKKYGPAKHRAILVGTNSHNKQKQRAEYYGWAGKAVTYVASVVISGPVLDNEKQLESVINKTQTFFKNVKEAK